MKPNTPTKMTMISHITYSCSWSMSRAIGEAASWKYHGTACAAPATASPRMPARAAMTFIPLIAFVPGSDAQSLRQLGGELDPRGFVEMPSDLKFLPRTAQQHAAAGVFLHADPGAPRVELVARLVLGLGHLDAEPSGLQLDALVVGGAARIQHERGTEQQDFEACERQHQPGARDREAGADRQHQHGQRREHAGEAPRRDRAVALEDQAEAAALLPEG